MPEFHIELPDVPEIKKAYRAATAALQSIASPSGGYIPAQIPSLIDFVTSFEQATESARRTVVAQLGPVIGWRDFTAPASDWDLGIGGIDCDRSATVARLTGSGVSLSSSAAQGPGSDWQGSALHQAALAYRQERGWDFEPGPAGIWLLGVIPVDGIGDSETMYYTGRLAGFAVLYDRDADGQYETLGHVWTATAWRRRGFASRLLDTAASEFGAARIEPPVTHAAAGLLADCPGFRAWRTDSSPGRSAA